MLCLLGTSVGLLLLLLAALFLPNKTIPASHAAISSAPENSLYTDTVIVMDNIDQIATHDPSGYRYTAAQLYVNIAPSGDNIGVVRIPSSLTQEPKILDLQPMNSDGKKLVNQKLGSFGPVDPGPTAYFTPALQTAGDILKQSTSPQNRKYIVLVTDAVALSGDSNPCPASAGQQYHNWFCTAGALEAQGIHLILLGFTKPGDEAALIPTKSYLEAHGGTVLQVEDGDDVAQRLAQTYTELLTRTHPNIFLANFNGTPNTLQISAQDKLTNLIFVGVGASGTSLSEIQTPSQENIAGRNDNGHTFTPGRGYWLEDIANGDLVGTWHLHAGVIAPAQLLAIGISEERFVLLNPAPSDPGSDIGIRYIAPQEPVVLRARVAKANGTPPVGIGFTVNPDSSNSVKFSHDNVPVTEIPDNQESDITAVLQPTSTDYITIGLGETLGGGTYFLKNFPVSIRPELANKEIHLNVPSPHLLQSQEGVPISAQGAATTVHQSLALFAQEANANSWTEIARNTTNALNVAGSFVPPQGCNAHYTIMGIEEISGTIATDQAQYDYLTLTQSPYQADIQQSTAGQATLSSAPYLEWWNSQATWNLQFSNTVCMPQTVSLDVKFQNKSNTGLPQVSILNGSSFFTLPANVVRSESVTASLGACSPAAFQDHTVDLLLTAHSDLQAGNEFIQDGPGWRQTMTCPSVLTNARRYWGWALIILLFLSIFIVRMPQLLILPFVPPAHLIGEIAIDIDEPSVMAEKGGTLISRRIDMLTMRIPYRLPVHSGTWYLERHETNSADVTYSLEVRDSNEAVLAFSREQDEGGQYVGVVATSHATGPNLPVFRSGRPVGREAARFDNEPIVVGNDLITPKLKISSVQ